MPRKTPQPSRKSSWKAWEGVNASFGDSYEKGFESDEVTAMSGDEEKCWPDAQRHWRNCCKKYSMKQALCDGTSCYRKVQEHDENGDHSSLHEFQSNEHASLQHALEMSSAFTAPQKSLKQAQFENYSMKQAPCDGRGTALVGRPICPYGASCYRKNPKHFEKYDHPWLDDCASNEESSLQHALEMSPVSVVDQEDDEAMRLAIAASVETYKAHIACLGSDRASVGEVMILAKEEDNAATNAEGNHRKTHTLKVTFRTDKRRLRVCWSCNDSTEEVFASIVEAVEEGFRLKICSPDRFLYALKYCDEDGDVCTLVESTVSDFLCTTGGQSTLQLSLEQEFDFPDVRGLEQHNSCEGYELLKFSIATPPGSPKLACEQVANAGAIENDFDSVWSLVGV